MPRNGRLATAYERLRGAFGLAPAVGIALAVVAGAVLVEVPTPPDGIIASVGWPGDAVSARDLLGLLAGTVMTVASLTFSLFVVALQLASSQFSPRLLRTFARDRAVQLTLAVFLATFAYCLVVLRAIAGSGEVLPHAAMIGAFVLAFASVAALVRFISHMVSTLRVDTMMADVTGETHELIDSLYGDGSSGGRGTPAPTASAQVLRAPRSGFVTSFDMAKAATTAADLDATVRLDVVAGDHVVVGRPVGLVWSARGAIDEKALTLLSGHLSVGRERTMQQDVAFGFRQLADIGVKAVSPGVNDPTTAVHATGHLSSLLVALARQGIGSRYETVSTDGDGTARVVARQRGFDELVDLAVSQLRRFSADEPAVVMALLGGLLDVAAESRTAEQRDVVREHVDLLEDAAARETGEQRDLQPVRRLAAEVHDALAAGTIAS